MAGKVFLSYACQDLAAVSAEAPLMAMLVHDVFLDVNSLQLFCSEQSSETGLE